MKNSLRKSIGIFIALICWSGILTVLADKIVMELPLMEGKGSTVKSKQNHLGKVHDGIWLSNGKESFLEFNGNNSYIDIPHAENFNFKDGFYLSAWIFPYSISGRMVPVNKGRFFWASGYVFYIYEGKLGLALATEKKPGKKIQGIGEDIITEESVVKPDQWTHIAVTYSARNGKARLYCNGRVVKEAEVSGKVCYDIHPKLPLRIGANAFSFNYGQFKGLIRNVKVCNSAMSPADIEAEYENGSRIKNIVVESSQQKRERKLTANINCEIIDARLRKPLNAKCFIRCGDGNYYTPALSKKCIPYGTSRIKCFYALDGDFNVKILPGKIQMLVTNGFEYIPQYMEFSLNEHERKNVVIEMHKLVDMSGLNWYCGDNELQSCGHGKRSYDPILNGKNLINALKIFQAEGLNWVNLVAFGGPREIKQTKNDFIATAGIEVGSRVLGDVIGINIPRAPGGKFKQIAAIDYINKNQSVCLFSENFINIETPKLRCEARGFAVALALGKCKLWRYAFEEKKPIGYKFLNSGFKVAAAAGTDVYINNHSGLTSPGYFRSYSYMEGLSWQGVVKSYRNQNIFVTKGPMLLLKCNGKLPGETVYTEDGTLKLAVDAYSIGGLEQIEIIVNGALFRTLKCSGNRKISKLLDLKVDKSCWLAVRCTGSQVKYFDSQVTYPGKFAHTAPVYIQYKDYPVIPDERDIAFALDWVRKLEKVIVEITENQKYPPDVYKDYMVYVRKAEKVFDNLKKKPRKWDDNK
ncbi:MAG: hypothetical protein PHV82_14910 [Victivallaceae bacterium]|nr:hypothetical protein [Victivallaceae bacterium]